MFCGPVLVYVLTDCCGKHWQQSDISRAPTLCITCLWLCKFAVTFLVSHLQVGSLSLLAWSREWQENILVFFTPNQLLKTPPYLFTTFCSNPVVPSQIHLLIVAEPPSHFAYFVAHCCQKLHPYLLVCNFHAKSVYLLDVSGWVEAMLIFLQESFMQKY